MAPCKEPGHGLRAVLLHSQVQEERREQFLGTYLSKAASKSPPAAVCGAAKPRTPEVCDLGDAEHPRVVQVPHTTLCCPSLCSWQPIMKFINDQYEKYLQEEININRKKQIPDTRVHCCIYFIPATGHSYVPAVPAPSALRALLPRVLPWFLGFEEFEDSLKPQEASITQQSCCTPEK